MNYLEVQTRINEMAAAMADRIDYAAAGLLSTLLNKPTQYKGRGRPRKTDYGLWEHPFDKKISRQINY